MEIEPWEAWVRSTELHAFVRQYEPWLWPLMQTLHLFGFTLLFGTVGFFDLRALGIGKGIPLEAIHRLVPWGVAGYIGNILLGIVFFSGHPEQYYYNDAFRLKLMFMAVAGINILAFYGTTAFAELKTLPASASAPLRIKIIAATSLFAWVAVLVCGRMITFNRPPFFH
jgi:uncharacterized protein DUF6644